MKNKLNLTIEQKVIEKAKEYAKLRGRSLSDIVENYLKGITKETTNSQMEIAPLSKSLRGSFNAPMSLDFKKELTKVLYEKYK